MIDFTPLCKQHPALKFLTLSEEGYSYLSEGEIEVAAFFNALIQLVGKEELTLIDLATADGLTRSHAVKGELLFERHAGEFEKFWLQTTSFWCDTGAIIRKEYRKTLDML